LVDWFEFAFTGHVNIEPELSLLSELDGLHYGKWGSERRGRGEVLFFGLI
jgi:hypothetical protein